MKFATVCSGIEAASAAWNPLGWKAQFFSEIEPFPCAVLKHHYPDVQNLGDMTQFERWPDAILDVLAGGTPCQSFSVAGLRKGLDDARGNLMLTFAEIAARYRPRWVVWENVPGVLSSGGGRDFAAFLGLLTGREVSPPDERGGKPGKWGKFGITPGIGDAYGIAWRVLDAQYFGVAQRRRRVFVVGHLGDWRRAAAVLLERESLSGNPPPSRKKGEGVASTVTSGPPFSRTGNERVGAKAGIPVVTGTLGARAASGGGFSTDFETAGGLVPVGVPEIVPQAMTAKWAKGYSGPAGDECHNLVAHTLRGEGFDASEDGTGRGIPLVASSLMSGGNTDRSHGKKSGSDRETLIPITFGSTLSGTQGATPGDVSGCLKAKNPMAVAITQDGSGREKNQNGIGISEDGSAYTLDTQGVQAVAFGPGGGDVGFSLRANPSHSGDKGDGGINTTMVAVGFNSDQSEKMRSMGEREEQSPTLRAGGTVSVSRGYAVRRLTPKECERLQGFPDGYTDVPVRGKPAADGPRYKALGNSWAVPCAKWIGERIVAVEAFQPPSIETGEGE